MNTELIEKIRKEIPILGVSQQFLAQYIISNPEEVVDMTIQELGAKSFCSASTVHRFITRIGFDSYYEFCATLKEDNYLKVSNNLIKSFELVYDFIENNKEIFESLILSIQEAKKIYLFASGSSLIPALDFERKFSRKFGDNIILFESEYEKQFALANEITEQDVVIFVSNSGNSRELLEISKICPNYILVTNRDKSDLSAHAKVLFNLNNNMEASFEFKNQPMESKYSLLYFFDQLFLGIISS